MDHKNYYIACWRMEILNVDMCMLFSARDQGFLIWIHNITSEIRL